MAMEGMTRRALRVAIDAVRRELAEAQADLAKWSAITGGIETEKRMGAQADDMTLAITRRERARNAERGTQAAKDRISEANLSLDWLFNHALFAKCLHD